jgi:hypothetical protein
MIARPAPLFEKRKAFEPIVAAIVPAAPSMDQREWKEFDSIINRALQDRSPRERLQLKVLLRVIQCAPILRYGRTFRFLTSIERTRFLSYLQSHRLRLIRLGFWGLRTLVLFGYYSRPAAARAIGYAPDIRGWEAWR